MPISNMPIVKLGDLREGDIFLGPIGGIVGAGVGLGELIMDGGFRVGTVDVRHAGIVVAGVKGNLSPQLAQAMPRGAEITWMTIERHWTNRCMYVRLPEDYPGQALEAAQVARAMVEAKTPYSPLSYLAIGAHKRTGGWPSLDAWISRTHEVNGFQLPVEAICSVFVDQAWTLADKKVMSGVAKQAVTPSALAQTLLWTPEAQFGWPGLHPFTAAL